MPPATRLTRPTLLSDRLEATRHRRFVGRLAELALFRSALLDAVPPFAVLHVFGPGGVGKTALLREYARIAAEVGRPVIQLDGRDGDASPQGFLLAAQRATGLPDDALLPEKQVWPEGAVWLIDTYETLAPLDDWLRETFLPGLPGQSLVVIAGRDAPAPAWRTDLGWADLTRVLRLGNLLPEESETYLAMCGVPAPRHANVLAFTGGHPLALGLVADALDRGAHLAAFDLRQEPDVVRVLLERLVREVPSVLHRRALDTCVLARVTTESLLADVLATADVSHLFAWLRRLSFIEQGPHGISPHDLAREVLDADLRWRNPADHQDLTRRLSAHLYGRLRLARGLEQQRIWADVLFLNRRNPFYQPYYSWEALGSSYAEPATPADHASIVAMVRRHQGDEAAEIARYWLRRQPEGFLAYRDLAGDTFGFMAQLAIQEATAEDIAVDPAIPAALAFAARHGPARPGEEIVYLRFWMHRDVHQRVSPAVNLTAINSSISWTSHPNLAWNFLATSDPAFLEPQFTSVHIWRAPDADFAVGGRRYGVFAHDWRVEPAVVWMATKADLAVTTDPVLDPPDTGASRLRILSQPEFAEATRQALRDYTCPDRLATTPLMQSRLLAGSSSAPADPAALQGLLRDAIASLTANPRDAKLHRALWHTYIEPAPTQEQAAELLDLPYNTYRYHLAKGIARVTDWLWRRELAGAGG
jgi:hypothetical protein